jgi:hypothetical protein
VLLDAAPAGEVDNAPVDLGEVGEASDDDDIVTDIAGDADALGVRRPSPTV